MFTKQYLRCRVCRRLFGRCIRDVVATPEPFRREMFARCLQPAEGAPSDCAEARQGAKVERRRAHV